ncbi:hypothetical protein KEM52_002489, partial [Ascosphaera acerosa]
RALYRALLRRCGTLRRTGTEPANLIGLAQQQFRKLRHLDSPTRIANAFKAGREALDLLHDCVDGSQPSRIQLHTLLQSSAALASNLQTQRQAQAATYRPTDSQDVGKRQQRRAEGRARRRPDALRGHPGTQPLTAVRPWARVSGRRRVPVLVNARGLPFLRIKKPQPPALSRALRSYLDNRWKRVERRDRLEEEMLQADAEDRWDEIVRAAMGHNETPAERECTWKLATQQALNAVNALVLKHDREAGKRAEAMFDVVLRERELAKQERAERTRRDETRRADMPSTVQDTE